MYSVRTDMADEQHRIRTADGKLNGVRAERSELFGLELSTVTVLDEGGAEALGRSVGQYHALSLPPYFERGSADFADCVRALSALILRCMGERVQTVLVAALGNPDITPDALGSLAAASVLVTRHLKQSHAPSFEDFASLALCRPGVLGTSGIESADTVRLLCGELSPELVIVIDALAGSEADRLCRCVQVSDTGIAPGSGVGNDRHELSRHSLGVPVVSVGIPTVIDAGLFGGDALRGMFVTPRGIDSLVRSGARLIGYAIDLAVHPHLSIEDIDALVG